MTDPNAWNNAPHNNIPQNNAAQPQGYNPADSKNTRQFAADPHQSGPTGPSGSSASPGSGSGSLKKIGIGALAVVVVGALAVGGFQVFKSSQSPEPNPAGISDEMAQEIISGGVDDCMLPKEIIDAAGMKDFERHEQNDKICMGYLATADGHNEPKVRISLDAGGMDGTDSDVEGWNKVVRSDEDGELSLDDIVAELDDDGYPFVSSSFGCQLYSDVRPFRDISLAGPNCESLYPIARQLNNLKAQDDYLTQKTDFFEMNEMPEYSPIEPAGQHDATIEGFIAARDGAPEGETELSIEQLDFENVPYQVKGVTVDDSSEFSTEVCVDLSFTASERKDRSGGTYYLPKFVFVSARGDIEMGSDRDLPYRLTAGDDYDYQQCASIFTGSSDQTMRNVDYLILAGIPQNDGDRSEQKFLTDGKANVVGKFNLEG